MGVALSVFFGMLFWMMLGGTLYAGHSFLQHRRERRIRAQGDLVRALPEPDELEAMAEVDYILREESWDFSHKLYVAKQVRDALVDWAYKLEIVGSLRRGAPEPGDVDILVVPRRRANPPYRFLTEELMGSCLQLDPEAVWLNKQHIQFHYDGVKVDIIISDLDDWGANLLNYTGSREFNEMLAKRAKQLGYKVEDVHFQKTEGSGYSRRVINQTKNKTEEEVLQMLGLAQYNDPRYRSHV